MRDISSVGRTSPSSRGSALSCAVCVVGQLARLDDEIAFEGTRVARAMEEGDQVRWSTAAVAIEEGALRVDRAAKATDRRIQATATRTIACTAEELARAAGYKGPGLFADESRSSARRRATVGRNATVAPEAAPEAPARSTRSTRSRSGAA